MALAAVRGYAFCVQPLGDGSKTADLVETSYRYERKGGKGL